MDKLLIRGPKRLKGEVTVSGAKNAALGVLPAALLLSDACTIENIPNILDIAILRRIMESLGTRFIDIDANTLRVDPTNVSSYVATSEDMHLFRGSYYLMGALLGRFRKAVVTFPGGCNFGVRPIDQHIKGFEALGAKVEIEHGHIKLSASKLTGANIYLDVVSVGATVNIMLAAVKAEGVTTIENAAKEPHIVDIANFLNAMGADIKGAGTDIIRIRGVKELKGNAVHSIIPDQIEAGTYMIAAAATKGDVLVKNVIPKHMESLSAKLIEMNIKVEEYDDSIRVWGKDRLNRVNIKTLPYPGFPTDLQPIMSVLLLRADGISTITESIFDNRFQYIEELRRMGAKVRVEGRMAVIEGGHKLTGAPIKALDLRAGATCVLAGCIADGVTEISNVHYIDRGYERMVEKLTSLGADIKRISDNEPA
ncbi:MAG TPA: UDP-N-acetylglucosamine 1-carboxyvinyltransferase [Thermoclostridium caenicola]|uniref:UDP-N-acetylglucosamine 1-carboxyvinyltransferase n=1 Tax=Thermoclostridium caenicola TaxID=659425 RepID=UPI002C34FFBB|nr:UDP-N-acetylglucosamine 1-carboxyvinyltransferase [Thermoclostridium caenicola]HPO77341.1 UDP-N-acetylglucosamine 1-carboxyvinyltransferase [Thermoclostridium caenicola]